MLWQTSRIRMQSELPTQPGMFDISMMIRRSCLLCYMSLQIGLFILKMLYKKQDKMLLSI